MGISIYSFLKIFQICYLDSVLQAWWLVLPTVFARDSRVSPLRNTQRHSHASDDLYVCVCVCVCAEWEHNSLSCRNSTASSLDWTSLFEFKLMHTEANLVVVGGLGVALKHVYASQQTSHSSGLRGICRGLSHCSQFNQCCCVVCRLCPCLIDVAFIAS